MKKIEEYIDMWNKKKIFGMDDLLRKVAEDKQEECALLCEANIVDKSHNEDTKGIGAGTCHILDAKKIRSIKIK